MDKDTKFLNAVYIAVTLFFTVGMIAGALLLPHQFFA